MKRFATLSMILLCGSVAHAQSLNPTGYWEYNNNFISSGSNTSNVVTNSNAATATRAGVVGTAADFNGTNQQLTLNIGFGTGSSSAGGYNLGSSFTVSTWYLVDSLGTGSKRTYIWEGRTSFDLSFGNGSAIPNATVYGPTTAQAFSVPNSMTTGSWRHLTQVYAVSGANTTMTAYLDGVQVAQGTAASSGVGDTGIKLANARDGQSRFLDGALDETAVYNRALTANEVIRSYRMGENGITLTNNAAMWTPTVTNSEWLSSGANNNWSLGAATFAGEGNNAASTNTQIALISSFAVNPATIGIDFADAAVAGELGLGAIVFNSQSNNLAINNSSSTAGIVTLNGNTVNSIPNTIFSLGNSINTNGSLNRNLTVGDGAMGTLGIRLGNTANVVQVAAGRTLTLNSAISERNALSTVTVQGGGAALFNRNTSYTGNTTVTGTGSTLQYGGGTNHVSSVTVATGAGLGVVNSGTNLTANNTQSLTFDIGSTQLSFSAATWNTSVPFLDIDGAVTTNGTTTITAVPNATGVYTLLNYGSLAGNGFGGFALAAFPTSRESGFLVDDSANNAIKLNYTAGVNVLWTGANTPTWDINTTENWKLESSNLPTNYLENDKVVFNDTATGPTTITLDAIVNPSSVLFDNTMKNYEITGIGSITSTTGITKNGSGSLTLAIDIAGSSGITKNGTGLLTLINNNTYTGATTVNDGILQVGNGGTSGAIAVGSAITINTPGTLRYSRSDTLVSLANVFSGSGTLEFLGTGVSAESGYQLTANNSGFTGTIIANQARVRFDSQNNAGAATLTTSNNGQFFLVGGTYTNTFNIAGNGWTEGAGQLGALRMASGATISGPVNLLGNARLTAFSTGETGTISGQISGNFGLEVTSGAVTPAANASTTIGRITLSNPNNNFTGGIVSNGGTVILTEAGTGGTGSITMGPNVVSSATYFSGFQPFLAAGPAASVTIPNNIVVAEPTSTQFYNLMKNGTAGSSLILSGVISGGNSNSVLQLDSPTGGDSTTNFTLSGTNTLAGTVRLNRGYINITNANALGTASLFVQTNSNAAGSIRFTNSFTLPNNITINTANDHISVGTNNVELSGILASNVAFHKLDSGTLTLSNDSNAMNANLTIAGGTLRIGNGGATGSFGAGNIVNNAALEFNRTGTLNFPSFISGTGTVTQSGTGTTILTGNNTYSGQTTISSGTLSVDDGSISLSSNIINNAVLVYNLNSNTGTYQNVISGTGSLTKSGTNILTLDGENSYNGTTTVSAGKLLINGNSSAATGAVAVGALATLGGSGIVGGLTTVADTGIIAPGNSAGNLTFANGLNLSAGGVYSWELGALSVANPGTDFDLITVSGGNLTLGGTSALTLDFGLISGIDPNSADAFWTSSKSWKIVDVTTPGMNAGDMNFNTITNASYTSGSFATTVGTGGDLGDIFLLFTPAMVGNPQWIGTGNWSTTGNWQGAVPNSATAVASFLGMGTGAVTVDAPQTVNQIVFNDPGMTPVSYSIGGTSTLSVAGTTPSITNTTGSNTITSPLNLANGTAINVTAGSLAISPTTANTVGTGVTATVNSMATLTLGGTANALNSTTNIANAGTLTVSGTAQTVGNISGAGSTTVSGAGTAVTPSLIANDIDQTSLTISNGAYVRIAASGTSTSAVTSLTMGTTANLDISDNDVVINNPTLVAAASSLTAVAARVNAGFAGGNGIVTNTFTTNLETVGFALNDFLSFTNFGGVTVNTDSVLIKYTYFGDSNLDGFVTDDDLGYFLAGYGTDVSANPWAFGDYNHDGFTTDDDLGFFLAAYGSTPGLSGSGIQPIPEPSTLVLGTLAGLGLGALSLRRRRAKC